MPFQKLFDRMLSVPGVESVIFLDSQGEAILHSGNYDVEKLKILGAYQGLLVGYSGRLGLPSLKSAVSVYEEKSILTHCLKDGYFVCVIFSPELNLFFAQHSFQEIFHLVEQEL
jgi:hypothetical protein